MGRFTRSAKSRQQKSFRRHSRDPAAPATTADGPAAPPKSAGRQLIGNAVAQMLSKFGTALIGLVLTPFIVGRVGLVEFGLWALVLNMITYVSLTDPGIATMVLRYAAKYKASGEMDNVRRILVLGMLFYLILGVLLSPLGLLLLPILSRHLRLPRADIHLATTVLILGYCYYFASSTIEVLNFVLIGLGDLWLVALIDFSARVMYALVVVALLLSGGNVLSLILATYIQLAGGAIATFWIYRRRHGTAFGNPFRLTRGSIKEMVQFGGWVQLATVADLATTETDPLVIGVAFSVANVGVYTFADTVASQIQFLPLSLLSPITAAATTAFEQGRSDEVRRLSVDGTRLLNLLGLGVGGLVAGLGPTIFRAWLGRTYPNQEMFLFFLVGIYALQNLTSVGFSIATAIGRPDLVAKNLLFGTASNIIGTVAFALLFGLPGVLAGSLLGTAMRTAFFERRFYELMDLRIWEDLFSWLLRLASAVTVAGVSVRLISLCFPSGWGRGRGGAITELVSLSLLYGLILILALRLTRFLRPSEVRMFSEYLPGPLRMVLDSSVCRLVFGHRRTT
jgi:O-antigen/teichoic acid export membrane protein